MKKGFTLLELIIVVIIIGILATLGFTQYSKYIERSRGAEAKTILGDIRTFGAAYYMEHTNLTGLLAAGLNIGDSSTNPTLIPDSCNQTSHYFKYSVTSNTSALVSTATRCTAGGKAPFAPANGTISLTTDFSTGTDTWGGSGNY